MVTRKKRVKKGEYPEPLTGPAYIEPEYEAWVHAMNGERRGIVSLSGKVFSKELRKDILHRNVVYEANKERGWSHKQTKNRGEIRGSTRKPYRQKGTGRARRGTMRAPHHVGGSKAHGPVQRDMTTKLPRKVIKLGKMITIAERYRENNFFVFEDFKLPNPKTAAVAQLLKRWGWDSVLFVLEQESTDRNFELACRNLPNVDTSTPYTFNVKTALNREKVVFSLKSVGQMQEYLERERPIMSAISPKTYELAQPESSSPSGRPNDEEVEGKLQTDSV